MEGNSIIYALAVGLTSLLLYDILFTRRQPAPFPPGPKPLPILGNILDIPQTYAWKTYAKWSKKYGGITHVTMLGTHIIIVNDLKYCSELLDKKGKIYSDRPRLLMGGQLVGWAEGPALCQFTDTWSEYRKLMTLFLGSRAKVENFNDVLQSETNEFLKRIREKPRSIQDHCRNFAGTIVLNLTYGYKANGDNDPLIKLVGEAMSQFSETAVVGAFAVDTFPILRFVPSWFPGAEWKRKAKRYRLCLEEILEKPYEWSKQQMVLGTAIPCFLTNVLEGKSLTKREERVVQWAAAGIYSGGADTIVAGLMSFILGITRHTAEFLKAQAEIDSVIGTDRLPTLSDRSRLPYFDALCSEIFRKYTFGPLGLPHVAREDDVHDGYYIPKGSIIISVNWQFYQDERLYPNPQQFSPERFLGGAKQQDPKEILFGYGRRICPGIHLAEAMLWLGCVNLVAAFDVSPPIKEGKHVIPPGNFQDGAISYPEPFECYITPRSKHSASLMQ